MYWYRQAPVSHSLVMAMVHYSLIVYFLYNTRCRDLNFLLTNEDLGLAVGHLYVFEE